MNWSGYLEYLTSVLGNHNMLVGILFAVITQIIRLKADRVIFGIFWSHYIPEFVGVFFFARGFGQTIGAGPGLFLWVIILIITMILTKSVNLRGLCYAVLFMLPFFLGFYSLQFA